MSLSSKGGHSALVKIRLLVNGGALEVAQMGSDCLFVDSPVDLPPGEATVVLRVDESERRWRVRLPEGVTANSERVPIAAPT